MLGAEGGDAVRDVVEDLGAEFHAWWGISTCVCLLVVEDPRGEQEVGRWMDRPNMRVFGKRGLRATRRPPKPQPMSAISTCFVSAGGNVDGGDDEDAVAVACTWVGVRTKAGKCFDQSISDGLAGLYFP